MKRKNIFLKAAFCVLAVICMVFFGCESNTTPEDPPKPQVDAKEYYKDVLQKTLPTEVHEENIKLTTSLSNGLVSVTWIASKSEIVDGTWIFQNEDENYTLYLTATLESEETSIVIRFEVDVYVAEKPYIKVESAIKNLIPVSSTQDIFLPEKLEDTKITWECDKSYILESSDKDITRWIYPFNTEELYMEVKGTYTIEEEQYSTIVGVRVLPYTEIAPIDKFEINTNGVPITSKEEYVTGTASFFTYTTAGFVKDLDEAALQIKLRGNSTFALPKKPYRLKFDKKQTFYDDGKSKSWVLLANYVDQSLMRDYLAYNLGKGMTNLDWSPSAHFVDVYVNGVYQGNYTLTNQIEVGTDRVNIDEKSTDINTGYLMELDTEAYNRGEATNGVDSFTVEGLPFIFKSPDTEKEFFNKDQLNYISNYVNTAYDAIKKKSNYNAYIDLNSFVDWCIVNEVFKNCDCGFSSVYFVKDKDGLLKMGPVWDFDLSSGNAGHDSPEGRGPYGFRTQDRNNWYRYLFQIPEFTRLLKQRWNEVYPTLIQPMMDTFFDVANSFRRSSYENFQLWDIIGKDNDWYTAPETLEADTYAKQLNYLYTYLQTRIAWLTTNINKF